MYIEQPKKLMILYILDIMKNRTDAAHRLSQQDIIRILKSEYSMSADRKAVKRNLMNLIACGYPIEYTETIRKGKTAQEESIYSDWYMEHEFSEAELRLLIDSLLFSNHIPYSQCRRLIEKIEGLSSVHFKSNVRHICNLPENLPTNDELFLTIEVLDEAISKGRQVSFVYSNYDVDKKPHPRLNEDGKARKYLINPYQMAATNGKYYLICNYDPYDNVANYRVDRITDIKLLDTPAKPMKRVSGLEHGLNLPKHMAEHIYMFSGESIWVTFRAKRYLVSDIIDWFGKDVNFTDITEEKMNVIVKVSQEAMRLWAMQYALHIKVLAPQSLRDNIRQDLEDALKQYAD